ncbi:hypothetical protein M2352_004739 [Azospirillum fermentarium]|uniref:hypothetical protein n=1 Tax=Azospirillum fermentarium TaxID=1233114 RepID=UPI002227A2FD|nr:hypothetical protein [Azospirillum fermentarium]MCW2249079.1 hypothetical protein [Azospirillum fermentarium]
MMHMRHGFAAAALILAACAPEPPAEARWTPRPVTTQSYVPSIARPGSVTASPAAEGEGRGTDQPPRPRRGSSTPPPMLNDPGPPRPIPLPAPSGSEDATARFKQDLMRPDLDRLRHDDAMGRLSPFEQRDLLNREQEMHRLETDPLRR